MNETISPYALLRASMPKPAPTVVTAYDLYSAAQAPAPNTSHPALPAQTVHLAQDIPSSSNSAAAAHSSPPKRTHYIADIHARHNQLLRQSFRRQGV